jgi:hypothetical protein
MLFGRHFGGDQTRERELRGGGPVSFSLSKAHRPAHFPMLCALRLVLVNHTGIYTSVAMVQSDNRSVVVVVVSAAAGDKHARLCVCRVIMCAARCRSCAVGFVCSIKSSHAHTSARLELMLQRRAWLFFGLSPRCGTRAAARWCSSSRRSALRAGRAADVAGRAHARDRAPRARPVGHVAGVGQGPRFDGRAPGAAVCGSFVFRPCVRRVFMCCVLTTTEPSV